MRAPGTAWTQRPDLERRAGSWEGPAETWAWQRRAGARRGCSEGGEGTRKENSLWQVLGKPALPQLRIRQGQGRSGKKPSWMRNLPVLFSRASSAGKLVWDTVFCFPLLESKNSDVGTTQPGLRFQLCHSSWLIWSKQSSVLPDYVIFKIRIIAGCACIH